MKTEKNKKSGKNIYGYNLLDFKFIRNFIDWKGFPYVFQFIMLLIFILLIIIGWQVYTPEGLNDKLFAKSNLVTLLIWGIWWPLMVLFAVTFGRVWCMICPLEFVANITERLGRKIGVIQKPLKKWMLNGAIIVFLYALIQLLIAGVHLHRIPAYTSFFLIGLLTLSAYVGLFFKDRAFCSGFCPIGMLLNAYGRGGMIAVRSANENTCTAKNCLISHNRNRLDSRSCPSLLNPSKLNTNKDCLVCTQCFKSCEPNNMQLLIRTPFNKNDDREKKSSWSITIFIMLVSGFVTSELTTEWKTANKIFTSIPDSFTNLIQADKFGGFIEGFWTFVIFPLLLWLLFGLILKLTKSVNNITDAWRQLALPLVIIISAGHLAKAVAKLNSWLEFVPKSLADPSGQNSLKLIAAETFKPSAFLNNQIVSVVGIVLLIVALFLSIREEKIINGSFINIRLLPKFILFIIYITIVFGIGV
jgi:hypothetical protein